MYVSLLSIVRSHAIISTNSLLHRVMVPQLFHMTIPISISRNLLDTAIFRKNSFLFLWRGWRRREICAGVRSTTGVDILLRWRSRSCCLEMLRRGLGRFGRRLDGGKVGCPRGAVT